MHDGGENTPSYEVIVTDGVNISEASSVVVTFTPQNDGPQIQINALEIDEGGIVVLNESNLKAFDPDTASAALLFAITGIQHGQFELLTNLDVPVYSFTQLQISYGQVQFVHDGGELSPSCNITVSDGAKTSSPEPFNIIFHNVNDPPYLLNPLQNRVETT